MIRYKKITINGAAGTGTSTLGKMLAEEIGYKFISGGDIIRQLASEKSLTLEEFHKERRKNPQWDHDLDRMQVGLGKNDENLVVESRMGWHFIDHPKTFRVLLVADDALRHLRIWKRDKKEDPKLSLEECIKLDAERLLQDRLLYKKLYNVDDYLSPLNYNLTLMSDEKPVNINCETLIQRLEGKI